MSAAANETFSRRARLDRYFRERPDLALIAPFMTYLLLLGLRSAAPPALLPIAITAIAVGAGVVAALVWRHLPPLGNPHAALALAMGYACAALWISGQYFFDSIGLGGRLPGFPGEKVVVDPREALGANDLFRWVVVLRVLTAVMIVPIVEELFWRGFMLRALIDWQHPERVPLGKFTWFSFLGTSLLSTVQHPDNWGVSILCWMIYNGIFYWTRSLQCLMIIHGMTNLALYIWLLRSSDWSFW